MQVTTGVRSRFLIALLPLAFALLAMSMFGCRKGESTDYVLGVIAAF